LENRIIIDIEEITKIITSNRAQGSNNVRDEFYQTFKSQIIFMSYVPKNKEEKGKSERSYSVIL
jgi:hypothetical protein